MLHEFPLHPRIADHAAAFALDSSGPTASPRQAATVVLLRDAADGPEVFLMRRTPTMAFAASMHVFPGGGVDPRDCDPAVPWSGPTLAEWAGRLGTDERAAAGLVCAAVRELFEECGVLLAAPDDGPVVADLSNESWEVDRQALLGRTLALSELLRRRGLRLRTDLLSAWSRWCTPAFEPRRYDTWFFVAALPAGQRAREVGGEADHADWLPVSEAVHQGTNGALAMMPPTLVTLQEVGAARPVDTVLAEPRALRQVMPWLVRSSDGLGMRVDLDGVGGGDPGPAAGIEG